MMKGRKAPRRKAKPQKTNRKRKLLRVVKKLAAPVEMSVDAATPGGTFSLKDTE